MMEYGMHNTRCQGREPEDGSVLIIALVMLVVLSALAMTVLTTSIQEQRMSVNSQEQDIAFQAAETGLRTGEAMVQALTSPDYGTSGCAAPCIVPFNDVNGGVFANSTTLPWSNTTIPSIGSIVNYSSSSNPSMTIPDPEYVVEYIGFMRDPKSSIVAGGQVIIGSEFYRVTASGSGRPAMGGRSVLQTIYARQF